MKQIKTFGDAGMNDLLFFANKFNLSLAEAKVLPALLDHAAKKTGMTREQLIAAAAHTNNEAGEYLASVARTVVKLREAA